MPPSSPRTFLGFDDPWEVLATPARLRTLRSTGLVGDRENEALDRLTRLAARVTGSPIALVSLIEPHRQFFCAAHGLDGELAETRQTPLSHSFCQYVVANDDPLVIDDAREHPVLQHNPAVWENDVTAYAGYPLRAPDGSVLGTLCVVDPDPRVWTDDELAALEDLAATAEGEIELLLRRRESRLSGDRLQRVVDGAVHTAIVGADADGVINLANSTAQLYLGVGEADLVGIRTLADLRGRGLLAGPDRQEAEAAEERKDRGEFVASCFEPQDWAVVDAFGQQRMLSVSHSVLRDDSDQVDGHLVMAVDVSVQREAERRLRDTVDKQAEVVTRLEELNRARGDFIATASHELRTPVTSILGYTELLLDGVGGDMSPGQSALLAKVQRNSERLLVLVQDLLDLSRAGSGAFALVRTTVDPAAVAAGAWEGWQEQLGGRDLSTRLDVAPGLPTVRGDALQLERVLLNLLGNAAKYTADGGVVTLDVHHLVGAVELVVSDTGMGIAPEEQAGLFTPFFRTRDAHERAIPGSGLGLAVVRQIVAAHDGTVDLRSRVGRGTTVTVTLPTG
ncbi:ATP-binding protein [Nocardioides sp. SYSU DS0663]|uniref:ATP-binding protein n=1 Tax=Nocardioides sp. SYSU DS0663 TaxID=3416445 RepID=UPI003F4B437D